MPAGSFWGAYGATLVPWYNAYGAYVTDPTVAVTNQGSPSNPAGMTVPAFNSSFGFFMVLMGKSDKRKGSDGECSKTCRLNVVSSIAMPCLPDLLTPHQRRLLRDILQLGPCIQLPRGRLLQSGLVLREHHER